MTKTGHIALIAAVAMAAAAAGYGLQRTQSATPITAPATAAELNKLKLPDANGTVQDFSQWSGKVLVINFWATWCAPCREEIPAFVRLSDKFSQKGVQFVGISIDSADKVTEFAREYSVSYPLLLGTPDTLQQTVAFGNKAQALPFTVVLDTSGDARLVKLGKVAESVLDETLTKLVGR